MSERDLPTPVGDNFDDYAPTDNGYIALPPSMRAGDTTKIHTMFPGDCTFISAGSAQVDERSYRVSIDTNDNRQPIPETLRRLREQPAIMRVLRSIGEHATNMVDGYIIDFRWVQKIIYDDRGLDEGTGSAEFMQRQQDYKTVLPLGAVFQDDEKTLYVGHPALHNEALQLAGWVDGIARSLGAWNDTSSKPPLSK